MALPPTIGALDDLLGRLLETWTHQYAFEFDRAHRVITFSKGPMIAAAAEVGSGTLRVAYECAPGDVVDEYCTPEQAAWLVDAIMGRSVLCRVPTRTEQPRQPRGTA